MPRHSGDWHLVDFPVEGKYPTLLISIDRWQELPSKTMCVQDDVLFSST
jgi:hypothetical protein